MYLSKSKYCNGVQCKKMLWLDANCPDEKEDVANDSVLDNGTEVGELAKGLFGESVDIEFCSDLKKMIQDTDVAIRNHDCAIITEASFTYENNFCSVDLLKKENDEYEIYEVKSSTEVKDIYLDDISYQYYVLMSCGLRVRKCCIVHINNKYERIGELELNKLFHIEDVTDIVLGKQEEVKTRIYEINEYMKQIEEPTDDIGNHCVKPYDCPFFGHCTKHLEKPNVFDLRRVRSSKKFDYYHNGFITFADLLETDIDEKSKEQMEYEIYEKEDKINPSEIQKFMSTLSYPLYFLDFETYQQSIPQYSLHYVDRIDGELFHKEFLAEADMDPRRSLAEQLVADIPEDVCTVAYNMRFEKMVISNLAKLYPDLADHLMNIHDHMRDLMVPFYNRFYYTKDMHGSYSIKYVLPALFPNEDSLNYHNLEEVHNGSEAMNAFANMGKLSKEDQLKLRHNLLKYCELDTYAMVKIWERLKEI